MQRTIILNGQEVTYTLNIKKVKRLNLRVKNDGSVVVSANASCSVPTIEKFISDHADFVLNAIKKYSSIPLFNYNDGDQLYVFGEKKALKIISGKNGISVQGDNVVLCVEDEQNLPLKKKGIDAFYKYKTQKAVESMLQSVFFEFRQIYNVPMPNIKYKKLTAAWGNCRKTTAEIHFSIYLSKVDMQCIKYVIVHELAHLIEANHSQKFYNVVQKIMPNYKLIRKRLKTYNI